MGKTPIPRYRERDTVEPLITSFSTILCNGSAGTGGIIDEWNDRSGNERLGNGVIQKTYDVVVPNFRVRSLAGEVFNNPFRSSKTTYTASPGNWGWYWIPNCTGTPTNVKEVTGNCVSLRSSLPTSWGGFLRGDPSWTDATKLLRTLAGTQALANVGSPEVLGGEFLSDIGRTIRAITHPLNELSRALQDLRKTSGFRKRGVTLGHYLSQEWLKYRYGYSPLVRDIVSGAVALTVPKRADRFTARGYADYPIQEVSDSFISSISESPYPVAEVTRYSSRKMSCRAGVYYQHVAGLDQEFGYSFNAIVPTLWEIFPWSFVADWAANFGDFFGAAIPKAHTVVLADWTTEKSVHRQNVQLDYSAGSIENLYIEPGTPMTASTERVEISRTPGVTLGLALKLNDLTLSRHKNWLHVADAFSLIAGLLYSKPGRSPRRPPRSRVGSRPREWTAAVEGYDRSGN